MAAILDFSKFSFSAEEIRAVKELLFDEVIASPEIDMLHTLYPGIVYDKEVGFIGRGGLVGVAGQGCEPTPQEYSIGTRKVKWTPKGWEILIAQCASDLEATAAVYSLKAGVEYDDFTSSDYMNIVLEVLSQSIKEFIIRLVWFSDVDTENIVVESVPTAAVTVQTTGEAIVGTVYAGVTSETSGAVKCALANKTVVYLAAAAATGNAVEGTVYYSKDTVNKINLFTGGQLTPGVDVDYFTILDGFFKQMAIQVVAKPKQRVIISENAGATYTDQELPSDKIQGYLKPLIYGADMVLRGKKEAKIFCTQSFYDSYEQSLAGVALETMYANMVNGQKTLTYKGVPLVPIPLWDSIIAQYYNNGEKLINPHRAVFTIKDVLAVGVDSEKSFGELDVWYNKDTRQVKIEGKGKADAKLLNPALFQIAI